MARWKIGPANLACMVPACVLVSRMHSTQSEHWRQVSQVSAVCADSMHGVCSVHHIYCNQFTFT